MTDVVELHLRLEGGRDLVLKGRVAWTAHALLCAGERGITPIERPAPRWSDYVFKLRGEGLDIETVDERHGGTYKGVHARYVWHTPVQVVRTVFANGECRTGDPRLTALAAAE